ncbi:AAA family ATPase [Rhodobacter sp. NTK016B]|uniref:AAA family ATPase n=1 Tax=Rhodobacter sp. NTK016B TaxID=2759676 RepID=UPI001A908BF5|nr:AAA family ATPase [Rhodobacter sp. NTK016B]MBN8290475.1 AAA family ATPase [Rhodobacter sp. NTK016B]
MELEGVVAQVLSRLGTGSARRFVALAGPPASGKSTLADKLAAGLGAALECEAAVVMMDGYHLDNAVLDQRGDSGQWRRRKGAPWTFDVDTILRDLERLRADNGPVCVPLFDRDLDLSRASAREIHPEARIIVVEGNYLLLDHRPWDALARFWDASVWLEVDEKVLSTRLIRRWQGHGFDQPAARARAMVNDLPNARLTQQCSRAADVVIRQDPPPAPGTQ